MPELNDKMPVTGAEEALGLKAKGDSPVMPGAEPPIEAKLKYGSQFHASVLERVNARIKLAKDSVADRYSAWDQVDEQVRLYADLTRGAKRPDGTTMTDMVENPFERGIVVPVSYAVLTVRLSQLMSIMLNRSPLWEIQGAGPEDMEPARLMESVIDYDNRQSVALVSLFSQMQDAEKYGLGIIYDSWEVEEGYRYSSPNPQMAQQLQSMFPGLPTRHKEWGPVKEYNNWVCVDPYRFWCDPRVPKMEFQKGEFAGHRYNRSYLYIKERSEENGGIYFNVSALPSNKGEGRDVTAKRDNILASRMDMKSSTDPDDKGYFYLDHLQVKLIPKDWGLGDAEIPEIWWFTIANEAVIIRAHPMAYDHGQFTYSVIEANLDVHSLHNPGNIENIDGLQRFMNWMLNSHLENIRKSLNDSLIYPPSLIEEGDLLNPGPARHIRLSQRGEELLLQGFLQPGQYVQQLQVADMTQPHLNAFQLMYQMTQLMMATNDPTTGQPTANKKTLGEVNQMMLGSGRRLSLTFRLYEAMGWEPLVNRSIANRQQFTEIERYFRILGDQMATPGAQRLLVKPWDIRGNFDYIPRSTMLPPDPSRQAMVWTQIMLGLGKFPQLLAPGPDGKVLDVRKIFNETVRNMGIRNIEQFYMAAPMLPPGMPLGNVQVRPDGEVADAAQRGNLAPLAPRMPGTPGMTP